MARCFLLLLAALPLQAGQVRPVNLEELTLRADRIFAGRCLKTETVTHPQLGAVIRVTFDIERAIAGRLGGTLTIQMIGGSAGGASPFRPGPSPDGARQRPITTGAMRSALAALDVPRFMPGERVVVFLYPDSALGLTSPVGLGQGKFSLFRDKKGREVAVNAVGNQHLLQGLSAGAHERVGVALGRLDAGPGLPSRALLDGAQQLKRLSRGKSAAHPVREPTGGRR